MSSPATLLVIADIGGYTRFLKMHSVSLVHAQHVVGRLLEAVIGAVRSDLTLAKLEGDAAFFHARAPVDDASLSRHVGAMHRAFHRTRADLARNALCPCDGCQQAGELKIKVVAHLGQVARQKIARREELAGVDVILVHRLLKNDVPVAEYLLVTAPLLPHIEASQRGAERSLTMDIADLGQTDTYYVELPPATDDDDEAPLPYLQRKARQLSLAWQTLPYLFGRRKPCVDFHNVPDMHDAPQRTL